MDIKRAFLILHSTLESANSRAIIRDFMDRVSENKEILIAMSSLGLEWVEVATGGFSDDVDYVFEVCLPGRSASRMRAISVIGNYLRCEDADGLESEDRVISPQIVGMQHIKGCDHARFIEVCRRLGRT